METVARKPVIQTVTIELDQIGYEGWWIELRTNPRSDMYEQWFSDDDTKVWEAFGYLVVKWNWVDEEGNPLPKPPECQRGILPIDLMPFVYRKYVDVLREKAGFPKVLQDNSNGTSSTGSVQETTGSVPSVNTPTQPTTPSVPPVQTNTSS